MNILDSVLHNRKQDAAFDEAKGRSHRSNLGNVLILILSGMLLVYNAWRVIDVLNNTIPERMQLMSVAGWFGLGAGAVIWAVVYIKSAESDHEDWIAIGFWGIDFLGDLIAALADAVNNIRDANILSDNTKLAVVILVSIIISLNILAGFLYHFFSEDTKRSRTQRRAQAELRQKELEAQDTLNRERMEIEASRRILNQRQATIDLREQMVQQQLALDEREEKLRRVSERTAEGQGDGTTSQVPARDTDIKLLVTRADEEALRQLGYTESAISSMPPELAKLLIKRRIESAKLDGHPKA